MLAQVIGLEEGYRIILLLSTLFPRNRLFCIFERGYFIFLLIKTFCFVFLQRRCEILNTILRFFNTMLE